MKFIAGVTNSVEPLLYDHELNIAMPDPLCGDMPDGCDEVVTLLHIKPLDELLVQPVGGNVELSKLSDNKIWARPVNGNDNKAVRKNK